MCCAVSMSFLSCNEIVGCNIRETGKLISWSQTYANTPHTRQTCDSNRLQSIQTPFPVFWREIRAAIIAPWAYSPVEISVTATPTLDGGRSGSPVLRTCGQYMMHSRLSDVLLAFYPHVHKPCFTLDHDVVSRRFSIRTRLSIA